MNLRSRRRILAGYDLLLAFGAVITGILMIRSDSGIFEQYPKEWLSRLPFTDWLIPGIIMIIAFGLGNMVSASVSLSKENNISWVISAGMGILLLFGTVLQIVVLREWFIATAEFLIFGILQLILSIRVFAFIRRVRLV